MDEGDLKMARYLYLCDELGDGAREEGGGCPGQPWAAGQIATFQVHSEGWKGRYGISSQGKEGPGRHLLPVYAFVRQGPLREMRMR